MAPGDGNTDSVSSTDRDARASLREFQLIGETAMRLHALLVMVVGLICAATTEALELRWSNGQQDLQHVNSGWRELVVSLGPA